MGLKSGRLGFAMILITSMNILTASSRTWALLLVSLLTPRSDHAFAGNLDNLAWAKEMPHDFKIADRKQLIATLPKSHRISSLSSRGKVEQATLVLYRRCSLMVLPTQPIFKGLAPEIKVALQM